MALKQRCHPSEGTLPETEERHRPQERVIRARRQGDGTKHQDQQFEPEDSKTQSRRLIERERSAYVGRHLEER